MNSCNWIRYLYVRPLRCSRSAVRGCRYRCVLPSTTHSLLRFQHLDLEKNKGVQRNARAEFQDQPSYSLSMIRGLRGEKAGKLMERMAEQLPRDVTAGIPRPPTATCTSCTALSRLRRAGLGPLRDGITVSSSSNSSLPWHGAKTYRRQEQSGGHRRQYTPSTPSSI